MYRSQLHPIFLTSGLKEQVLTKHLICIVSFNALSYPQMEIFPSFSEEETNMEL